MAAATLTFSDDTTLAVVTTVDELTVLLQLYKSSVFIPIEVTEGKTEYINKNWIKKYK